MGKYFLLLLFFIAVYCASATAKNVLGQCGPPKIVIAASTVQHSYIHSISGGDETTGKQHKHRRKLFAALLAFPLGVFGLHRLYLGTSAGAWFLYPVTFGGLLGILPFIDFIQILLCKDVNHYADNPRVFMWSRPTSK